MSFEVRSIAKRKHVESGFSESEWIKVLETARMTLKFVDIGYESLSQIAISSRSPSQFFVIVRLIYQHDKANPHLEPITKELFRCINSSRFSLADWLEAINYFQAWLTQQGRRADFSSMLRYLECCTGAPDAKQAGQTLVVLTQEMLDVHGYEGRTR